MISAIKSNAVAALYILGIAVLISIAVWPLENAEWAGTLRDIARDKGKDGVELSGIALFLPLVKVSVLIGIGACLTALVLGIIKFVRRIK